MKFAAIFWDNDGTLVDTEPAYFRATQEVLKKHDITLTHEWYANEQLKKGRSAFDLAREQGLSEGAILLMRKERDELYLNFLNTEVRVIDGVRPTLQFLHGKIPMGIVTTSDRVHFTQIMEATQLGQYFDFFITGGDVLHVKPDPEPYLKAWEQSGLPKEACLVIEDTERGLIAAKAAGLTCFVIPNELSKNNDFSKADRILKNVEELLNYL